MHHKTRKAKADDEAWARVEAMTLVAEHAFDHRERPRDANVRLNNEITRKLLEAVRRGEKRGGERVRIRLSVAKPKPRGR